MEEQVQNTQRHPEVVYKFIKLTREKTSNPKILETVSKLESMDDMIPQLDTLNQSEGFEVYLKLLLKHIEVITFINSFYEKLDTSRSYDDSILEAFELLDNYLEYVKSQEFIQRFINDPVKESNEYFKMLLDKLEINQEMYDSIRNERLEEKQKEQVETMGRTLYFMTFLQSLREKDKKLLLAIYKKFYPEGAKGNLIKLTKVQILSAKIIASYVAEGGNKDLSGLLDYLEAKVGHIPKRLKDRYSKEEREFLHINPEELEEILNPKTDDYSETEKGGALSNDGNS